MKLNKPFILGVLIFFFLCGKGIAQEQRDYLDQALDYLEKSEASDSIIDFFNKHAALQGQMSQKTLSEEASLWILAIYKFRDYKAGLKFIEDFLQEYQDKGRNEINIPLYYQKARGLYFAKQYQPAIEVCKSNMTFLENNSKEKAEHLNLMGSCYRRMGDFFLSLQYYEEGLNIRLKLFGENHNSVASSYNNVGVARSNLGLYNQAAVAYSKSIKIRRQVLGERHPTIGRILQNSAILMKRAGNYEKAIDIYREALSFYSEGEEEFNVDELIIFNNLGGVLSLMGANDEAHYYLMKAKEVFLEKGKDYRYDLGEVTFNLALNAKGEGDINNRIMLYQEALSHFSYELDPDAIEILDVKKDLAITFRGAGNYKEAKRLFLEVLDVLLTKNNNPDRITNTYNNLADVFIDEANFHEAKKYNRKAANIQSKEEGLATYKLAYTYNRLGIIALKESKPDSALYYARLAAASNNLKSVEKGEIISFPVEAVINKDYYLQSLWLYEDAKKELGYDLDKAKMIVDLHAKADSIILLYRSNLLNENDKIRFAQNADQLSQRALKNAYFLWEATGEQRFIELAFQYSEKSKANVLLQSLTNHYTNHFAGVPDLLIEMEKDIQSSINYYSFELNLNQESQKRQLFEHELIRAQENLRQLESTFKSDYPAYYNLKNNADNYSLDDLQKLLEKDEVIFHYFTADSFLYRIDLADDYLDFNQASTYGKLSDHTLGFRKGIVLNLDWIYEEKAKILRELLLPSNMPKDKDKLIFIVDKELSQIPFEALRLRDQGFLIEAFQISYSPSVNLWKTRKREKRAENSMLTIAPVFADQEGSATNILESFSRDNPDFEHKISFSALPASETEVNGICKYYEENGFSCESLIAEVATEKNFRKLNLQNYNYLHFATHGFINEDNPELSGLVLAKDQNSKYDVLFSGEIYNLSLNADLVVLSACETGLGKIAFGEGLLGFARAFFYAGTKDLILSMWKVNDESTSELMLNFYDEVITKKKSFSESLRTAKLSFIQSEEYSNPYYWAPFVLINGEGI